MDPAQAAQAAALLKANVAVPIHYDTLNHPPVYVQADRPAEAFRSAAERPGVPVQVMAPGDVMEL